MRNRFLDEWFVAAALVFGVASADDLIAQSNLPPYSVEGSKVVVEFQTNMPLSEITNIIAHLAERYVGLVPSQLRESKDLKQRQFMGSTEVLDLRGNNGVKEQYMVDWDQISCVNVRDKDKNGFTIWFVFTKTSRFVGMFGAVRREKSEGPFLQWYDNGQVRSLLWFTDNKMTKLNNWDANGKLTASKTFPQPIDFMRGPAPPGKQ